MLTRPAEERPAMADIPTGGDPHATRPQPMGEPLAADDRVGNYVIDHYVGQGSFGRVYVAYDHRDEDHEVVVKALRPEAPYARRVSEDERRTLRDVLGHPQIVALLNWVEAGPGDRDAVSYLILEHLTGTGLDQEIEKATTNGEVKHTEVPALLRRIRGVLDGVATVHSRGHAFNDFKPAHIKALDRTRPDGPVKLIDFGAVAPFGPRPEGPVFGSPGFSDPRLRQDGPSAASDIYAIGRTIMVAATGADVSENSPVPPAKIFDRCPALERLVRRATASDPEDRFESVDELAAALELVIRRLESVLADRIDHQRAILSPHFDWPTDELHVRSPVGRLTPGRPVVIPPITLEEALAALPTPEDESLVDRDADPGSQVIGLRSRVVLDRLQRGEDREAAEDVDALEQADPRGWRAPWYRGVLALRANHPGQAHEAFAGVANLLPGEIAPEVALALTAELLGKHEEAGRLYRAAWRADGRRTGTAFGAARAMLHEGRADEAAAILLETSLPQGRLGAARALLVGGREVTAERFDRAQRALRASEPEDLEPDAAVELLLVAWDWTEAHRRRRPEGPPFLGVPLATGAVRDALSRALARLADGSNGAVREEMIDLAQMVRRPSWW
jgi:serine/threonine-protein kinase PknG